MVILTDVHGPFGGTLIRLTADDHATATGRFVPHWAGFMWMLPPPTSQNIWLDDEPTESFTEVDPALLHTHGLFGLVAQWHLPEVNWGTVTDDGQPALYLVAPDGSRAVVGISRTDRGHKLTQCGPRRLWDRVEQAHQFWTDAGQPSYERFGITATPTEQHVWFNHPASKYRWELPPPADYPAAQPVG